jgi:uncharacterized protein
VRQRTDFPFADTTKIIFNGSGQFDIKVRMPNWATRGIFAKINGKEQSINAAPGTYLTFHRTWRDKDVIEIRMPFHFYLDSAMDQPDIAGIFYGPILFAAEEASPRTDWRPVTLDLGDPAKSINGDPATLHFKIDDAAFKPFYESYARYSVYLRVASRQ